MHTSNEQKLSIRVNGENSDHHLWKNGSNWWIAYTVHPTPVTKERVRVSLKTKSITEARRLRDEILDSLKSPESNVVQFQNQSNLLAA
jgi:hypothetical protein